jgi:benzylsuccinate CoA-transferase BbsF subunit
VSADSILQNIRILDFSWVLAGPYATRLLADFGAEVIKVQPLMEEAQDKFSQGYSNNWNRNKLGISLSLKHPEGIEIARKLVKISDIVVENFSPRVMSNWGLDFPELIKIKSDLIFLSMSVMGHSGAGSYYIGFGPTVQALAGITGLTAYKGQPPLGLGYSYADHIAGLYACLALLGALEFRRKTGKGQYIDLSQTETMASLMSEAVLDFTRKGSEAIPVGNEDGRSTLNLVSRCREEDRWCAISFSTETEWAGLKRAIGSPARADEERFSNQENRIKNSEALRVLLEEWTLERSDKEVMFILQKEGVPCGKVQNAADLVNDTQLKARGFFIELDHLFMGKYAADASPIHFSGNPAEYRRASPAPCQDNDHVYRQLLGLSAEEINGLRERKII